MAVDSVGGQAPRRPPARDSNAADPAEVVAEAVRASKSFGETRALREVSVTVRAGECHGLVGRNGAGKSTLVSLLTGLERPDEGTLKLEGDPVPNLADRTAWQRRVACVYQKSMVVPTLTVAENIFLNRPTRGGGSPLVSWRRMRSEARRVLLEWGFQLDVDAEAGSLTVEQRQVIEIARSLSIGARFLILDEPTAALEKAAIERLFEHVRRLREGGVGVLYISHHLEEIYEICDRVSVLRDGELILSGAVDDIRRENLVAAMVGAAPPHRLTEIEARAGRAHAGSPKLQVTNLWVRSAAGNVNGVSLAVGSGECVGLVGLNGSGSAVVADAVCGLIKPHAGHVAVDGRELPAGKVDAAVERGVAYIPQDRHARGYAPQLGVAENLTLTVLDRISDWGLVRSAARARIAREQVEKLQIVASSLDQPVSSLSGGNQQKVMVGRAFAQDPQALVVVNPTVGVDVASKEALLDAIDRARDRGMAVLLVSDDFEDLRVCDRLLVMVRGRISLEFNEPPWNREALIAAVEGLDGEAAVTGSSADG